MDEIYLDTEQLELLLEQNNLFLEEIAEYSAQSVELLSQVYTAQLFVIGVVGAVAVCVILYRFLRQFY